LSEPVVTVDPLIMLVQQLLLAATDDLPQTAVAAYVAGWTAALELVERTDLTLPRADAAVHAAIAEAVGRIRLAQRMALDDEPDDDPSALDG
jgi:hypothetical protein